MLSFIWNRQSLVCWLDESVCVCVWWWLFVKWCHKCGTCWYSLVSLVRDIDSRPFCWIWQLSQAKKMILLATGLFMKSLAVSLVCSAAQLTNHQHFQWNKVDLFIYCHLGVSVHPIPASTVSQPRLSGNFLKFGSKWSLGRKDEAAKSWHFSLTLFNSAWLLFWTLFSSITHEEKDGL